MVAMAKPWKHPNGTYYFRVAIPTDLQPKLGSQLRKYSLRTKDARVARQLFIAALEKFEQEMERHRSGNTLSPKQICALAGDWLREALDADEQRRDCGVVPDEEAYLAGLDSPYEHELDRMEYAESVGDRSTLLAEPMAWVQREHGVRVDPGTPEHEALINELFLAKLVYLQVLTRRYYGDWTAPRDLEKYPAVTIAKVRRDARGRCERASQKQRGSGLSSLQSAWERETHPSKKTVVEVDRAVRRFIELHGDVAPGEITKVMVRQYKEALLECPRVISGVQRGMPLPQLVASMKEQPNAARVSAASVNKHLGCLSALFAYGAENGLCGDDPNWSNPALGMKVKRRQNQTEKRLEYDLDDLKRIFAFPIFSDGQRPRGAGGEAAFWLPVVALYTGARMEELGQLWVSDIGEEDGYPYIHINTLDEGKRLKTESSHRKVPIHPELMRIGFLKYVREQREEGSQRVFPALEADSRGALTGNWSKWWGRYARKHGITDKRKVFHSFRHSFKTACRRAGIPEEVHDSITGHSRGGVGQNYGERWLPVAVTAPEIARVEYPGVVLGRATRSDWLAA